MMRRLLPPPLTLELVDLTDVSDTVSASAAEIEHVVLSLFMMAQRSLGDSGALSVVCESAWTDADGAAGPRGRHVTLTVGDLTQWLESEQIPDDSGWSGVRDAEPLGLALVRNLMARHKGTVRIETTDAGDRVVTVRWPVARESAHTEPEPPQSSHEPGGDDTIPLAQADDETRRMTRRLPESRGYTVLAAPEGEAALDLAHTCGRRVHLALLDLVMPDLLLGVRRALDGVTAPC